MSNNGFISYNCGDKAIKYPEPNNRTAAMDWNKENLISLLGLFAPCKRFLILFVRIINGVNAEIPKKINVKNPV
ncbi:MAG: hypothetical protein WBK45_03655, partial [Tepidanaerobacteraceae bacterium]